MKCHDVILRGSKQKREHPGQKVDNLFIKNSRMQVVYDLHSFLYSQYNIKDCDAAEEWQGLRGQYGMRLTALRSKQLRN